MRQIISVIIIAIAIGVGFGLTGCATAGTEQVYGIFAGITRCQSTENSLVSGIIGGKAADFGDPDQRLVSQISIMRNGNRHICTGSLLADRTVLTAAHCVSGVKPSDVEVRFVSKSGCTSDQAQTIDRQIQNIFVHEEFDGTPESLADIAVIELREAAPSDVVRLPLLPETELPTSDDVLLLGFGITDEKLKDAETLRRVHKSFRSDFDLRERSIVVNQQSGKGGFCRGDSGAPLIVQLWNEPYIIGVNSANLGITKGHECQTMSVAMRTSYFSDWIGTKRQDIENKNWIEFVLSWFGGV